MPRQQGEQRGQNPETDTADHDAIEANEVEAGTYRRLRRWNPLGDDGA